MSNTELLQQGLQLMLAGMGFVMAFLLILIGAIYLMSKSIQVFFPENAGPPKSPSPKAQATTANADRDRLRPVIAAAIFHHRRQQGLK